MTTTRHRLLATASRFVTTLESLDVDAMLAVRSPTCLHHMCLPSFRNYSITNDQTREAFPQWKATITKYQFGILDDSQTLVDEQARKVMIRAKTAAETTVGDYNNEYVFILRMTEDCDTVDEIWEFYDSLRLRDLHHRLEGGHVPIGVDAPAPFTTTGSNSLDRSK
ncbi:ausJ [Aspergillus calidoustus]|uniref:Austinoid biosynthesis cluster protein J n=1 Tax=Aspergillus calidoustus TaxID=454130 RepID=AUSJ_ASPCI|nr:RecName: Full=Austinoid biosynthesis cluster protein J [Aspergillus calidoustus]CEL11263.1 ausJ [Aspergillus calidoustus]